MAHQEVTISSFKFLVIGITHEATKGLAAASASNAERLAKEFKPDLCCVEAERQFHQHTPDIAWASHLPSSSSFAGSSVVCVDRPERVTRRRLMHRLAFNPLELFKSRRYGATPSEVGTLDDIRQWRHAMRAEVPGMYEVLQEEREEFMSWRTLIALERALAREMTSPPSHLRTRGFSFDTSSAFATTCVSSRDSIEKEAAAQKEGGNLPREDILDAGIAVNPRLEDLIKKRRRKEIGMLEAARRGQSFEADKGRAKFLDERHIAIVCGVAHVEAIASRLRELMDSTVLGENAEQFPYLLRAIGLIHPASSTSSPTRAWDRLRALSSSSSSTGISVLAFVMYACLPMALIYFPLKWDFFLVQENIRRRNMS